MRKIISCILVLGMLLSFVACGDTTQTTEKTTEYYSLYLDIEFEQNLIFATYDVEVYLDDVRVGLIPHGEHYTNLINDVEKGTHSLYFYKDGDHSIRITKDVTVKEDCTFITTIHSNKTSIESKGTSTISGIAGNTLEMPDLSGKVLKDAVNELKQIGFTNIHYSDDVWDTSAWIVISQSIEVNAIIDKNERIDLTCQKPGESNNDQQDTGAQQATEEQDAVENSDAVYYSTNTKETVKNGNSGVYAYVDDDASYAVYYIIDFDEGCVYSFSDGNGDATYDRIPIVSGDLNDVLIITLHDGNETMSYGLHFKWKNQPDHLVVQDEYGYEQDCYTTDLEDALNIMQGRTMLNWE